MSQKTGFYWLMDQHSFKRYNVFPIRYFEMVDNRDSESLIVK